MTDLTITIPTNLLALSVLCANKCEDGFDFNQDGFIYKNRIKVKKWFRSVGHIGRLWSLTPTVWHEGLFLRRYDDVAHRLNQKHELVIKRTDKLLNEIVARNITNDKGEWIAEARCHHKHTNLTDCDWWRFKISHNSQFNQFCYSYDWIDHPSQPINHDLGQKLYSQYLYSANIA